MDCHRYHIPTSRREFLQRTAAGFGATALAALWHSESAASTVFTNPHFAPKAKRVIFLFQSGGPSHLDLFDPKPELDRLFDQDLPDSVRQGQRITGMVANQARLALQPSKFGFKQCGQSGLPIGDLLPWTQKIADEICVIRSMHTEAINHDPAITFFQTGHQLAGRPSMGAWASYGLGSMNSDLPAYVSMVTNRSGNDVPNRLWGNGFLPSEYQGIKFLSTGDPVLYLSNPPGVDVSTRRRFLDVLGTLNRQDFEAFGDAETSARISQYELAARMQASVPELTDMSDEPDSTFERYGPDSRTPGTFAANCLLARRLAERDVRFIEIFHRGWDHHLKLPQGIEVQSKDVDQPQAALIQDLKERGMLDDTLVLWGGEFGRTVFSQGKITPETFGRDHHPHAFTVWMAGGGIKAGTTYGETDDFAYNIVKDPVHIHDLHATMLHLMGIDHMKLTTPFQGRNFRLTDIGGNVIPGILA